MADNGKFKVKEFTFGMNGKNLFVNCKNAEQFAKCGQNTARTFELPVVEGNLKQLMTDLRSTLGKLEELDKPKQK